MKKYLSIDIGGTYIKYAFLNHSGEIIKASKVNTPRELSHFLGALDNIVAEHKNDVRAIAVSSPGKIDSQTGTIYFGGSLPFLHEFSIKSYMNKKHNLYCSVINDGKAAALAELWQGALNGIQNGGVLTLGTGVGGGFILNGSLFEGSHFQAGEISAMITEQSDAGITEVVGMTGSAVGFINRAAKMLDLADLLDGKTVFNEIGKDNPKVMPLFQNFCRDIASVILNIQTVLDLDKIAIGGGISAQPILIQEIDTQYHKLLASFPLLSQMMTPVEITACQHKNESGLLGAMYQLLLQLDETNQIV